MFAIAAFNLLNVKRAKDAIIAEKKRIEDEKKAAEKAAEEKAKAEAAAIEAAKPAGLPKDADEKPVYLQDLSSVSFVNFKLSMTSFCTMMSLNTLFKRRH